MVAEMERLESAARLAMGHYQEVDFGGAQPAALVSHYVRLCAMAAVTALAGFLSFGIF